VGNASFPNSTAAGAIPRDRPTSSNSAANPEEANYFRTNLRSGQSIWICRPGALDRLRPVRSGALRQRPRPATICCSTDLSPPPTRHAGWGCRFRDQRSRTGRGTISASVRKTLFWVLRENIPPPSLAPLPHMVYSLLYPVTRLPRPSSPASPRPGAHTAWAGALSERRRGLASLCTTRHREI